MRKLFLILILSIYSIELVLGQNTVSFTSSNLPIVVIKTDGQTIPDEPKITADMGIIYNGEGVRNSLTDPLNNYNGKIGIEIRGSSSQMFPKKQYGIELWDAEGGGIDASLLGLPAEEDWILFAPYNDKSLMRDALAYRLARATGRYASRTKFCELVLNDQYMGIYVLMEKIKRDKNRVDINKLDPDENSGDDLTGGYIIKIDKTEGDSGPGWNSAYTPSPRSGDQTIMFQFEYPKYDEITAQQKEYIKSFVDQFENALAGENFTSPTEGYEKYIDVDSFVDYFLVNELTKNVDAYRLSTFLYKHRDSDGGKLFMGPAWDFNLGFGNADYCTQGNPEGFVTDFNSICSQDFWLIPFWWDRLLKHDTFRQKMVARWNELRLGAFAESAIHGYIDSVAAVLNVEARQRNFQAWPVLGQYVWPNYYVASTYDQEIAWLKNWVTDRLAWLDNNLTAVITGTNEVRPDLATAYPNPFRNEMNIEYTVNEALPVQIQITDQLGRVVHRVEIPVSSPGVYTYQWKPESAALLFYFSLRQNGKQIGKGKVMKGS